MLMALEGNGPYPLLPSIGKERDRLDWLFQVDQTANWLKQFGIWAVLFSLLLSVVVGILGIVPSLFLSGANALVFGLVPGFFVSLTGETLGAGVSFWLYRWGYKQSSVRDKNWKWVRRINESGRRRQMSGLLLARLTPLVPSGIITFAAACSSIVFLDFLFITVVGKAPSIALETLIGHDLLHMDKHWPRLLISVIFISLIYFLFRGKRNMGNRNS